MKNIITYSFVFLISFLFNFSLSAKGIVVSFPKSEINTYSKDLKEKCFLLEDNTKWCVPDPQIKILTSQENKQKDFKHISISVPDSLDLDTAINLLKNSNLYSYVEKDIVIKQASYNDKYYYDQTYFLDYSQSRINTSSINSMINKLTNPNKTSHVYVLDTGFRLHQDIEYINGYNFVDTVSDKFLESDFNSECQNSHGVGVSSVISAFRDNEIGIAGIVENSQLLPLRVMNCGSGYMSDAANALLWLSGESFNGLPSFTGQSGVINMSLGGKIGDSSCPFYLQDSINKVTDKGFVVVVAAGNQNEDADLYIPAKCENVITVGALNTQNTKELIDRADFSNYGNKIDIMAQGEEVVGLYKDETVAYWAGTSFSAPMVAGIISNLLKDFSLNFKEVETLISISGRKDWLETSECVTLGCGNGLLDSSLLYDNAKKYTEGNLNFAKFSLDLIPACKHEWALEHLENSNLCEKITVEVGSYILNDNNYIQLSAYPLNESSNETNTEVLGNFNSNMFDINRSLVLNKNLQARICSSENDCSEWLDINTAKIYEVPLVCQ